MLRDAETERQVLGVGDEVLDVGYICSNACQLWLKRFVTSHCVTDQAADLVLEWKLNLDRPYLNIYLLQDTCPDYLLPTVYVNVILPESKESGPLHRWQARPTVLSSHLQLPTFAVHAYLLPGGTL